MNSRALLFILISLFGRGVHSNVIVRSNTPTNAPTDATSNPVAKGSSKVSQGFSPTTSLEGQTQGVSLDAFTLEEQKFIKASYLKAGTLSMDDLKSMQKARADGLFGPLLKAWNLGLVPALLRYNQESLSKRSVGSIEITLRSLKSNSLALNAFQENPSFLRGMIQVFRDPLSTAHLIEWSLDRSAHVKFFAALILSFLASWAMTGHFVSGGHSRSGRVSRRIFAFLGWTALRIGLFVLFYREHLIRPFEVFNS